LPGGLSESGKVQLELVNCAAHRISTNPNESRRSCSAPDGMTDVQPVSQPRPASKSPPLHGKIFQAITSHGVRRDWSFSPYAIQAARVMCLTISRSYSVAPIQPY
jgi:hypothetical protein